MALREILIEGDPALRKTSREVHAVDDYILRLLDDMIETMRDADGVGLAAPQVGVLRRVCVIEMFHDDEENSSTLYELINPQIIKTEGENTGTEACLSLPGKAGIVQRPEKVTVSAMGRDGKMHEYEGEGLLARAFCHEIDHLDGKLYTDIMIEEVDLDADDDYEEEDA